jgi:peptide/nickel transport system permease protein
MSPESTNMDENTEHVHEQGTVYVDESNLDVVLSTKPLNMLQLFWKELRHDPLALIASFILIVLILGVYIGAAVVDAQMDVMRNNLLIQNQPPEDLSHFSPEMLGTFLGTDSAPTIVTLFGTDTQGRFVAPLMLVAARNSFNIGLAVAALSFIIGLLVGSVSGYFGGRVDNVIMRITDTWTMLPSLMCMIAIIAIVPDRTPGVFILIFTAFTWMNRTRLVRAAALQNRNLDYISASKTLGTRNLVIMVREMLPNMVDIIVANFFLTVAASIGIETGLTMIGWGLGMEHPSLGAIIANALQPVNLQFRWWTWAPAVVLVVTMMLSINFVGNVLQRVADPRQRLV